MDPGKGKTKRGNNSRQESNKKLRVKRTERKKERKRSDKKKRENTAGIKACINRPSFPSLLANPHLKSPKVIVSSYLGLFSKMYNLDGKSL